jgi:hypothetical protein
VTVGEVSRPLIFLSLSTYRLIRVITLAFKELSPFHFILSSFIHKTGEPISRVIRKLPAVLHGNDTGKTQISHVLSLSQPQPNDDSLTRLLSCRIPKFLQCGVTVRHHRYEN